jgi:hypothetical protein
MRKTCSRGIKCGAYLWLLTGGFGPLEATMYPKHQHDPRADVRLAEGQDDEVLSDGL